MMTEPSQKLALSIPEAARYSGLSRSGLYRALNGELPGGKLASIKVGGRRLIAVDDLTAFLAARRQA